jgi:predicted transport protein
MAEKSTVEDYLSRFPAKVQQLFLRLDEQIRAISDGVWSKACKQYVSYWSPERVFVYVHAQQDRLALYVFTQGSRLEEVKPINRKTRGDNWGWVSLDEDSDVERVLPALRASHVRTVEALKGNESSYWPTSVEEITKKDQPTEGER